MHLLGLIACMNLLGLIACEVAIRQASGSETLRCDACTPQETCGKCWFLQHRSELETTFVMSYPDWSFVSSSGVREVAAFGGDVSSYVTPRVNEALKAKFTPG